MNDKALEKDGSQSREVIDDFSEGLRADLIEEGYEGEALEQVFANEKASFVSAVNQFKEAVRQRNADRQSGELPDDELND
ncbi:hypothetical protein SAAL107622_12300 [Lacicoccus alkaliphilus]|uniref:Uncharacterized protein n=2 Tax=Lacicoccus TaxID=3076172 RepID=A0A1M7JW80_9BACL|nr:hypothetical protein SAMN02745189_02398 [Salinicoccus alkaliphilus DSM 16010]